MWKIFNHLEMPIFSEKISSKCLKKPYPNNNEFNKLISSSNQIRKYREKNIIKPFLAISQKKNIIDDTSDSDQL